MKRSKIKLREKRSRKPYSVNKNVEEYLKFLVRMRFQVLQSNNKYDMNNPLWGRFTPQLVYNMYQVLFLFLVNHDITFTKMTIMTSIFLSQVVLCGRDNSLFTWLLIHDKVINAKIFVDIVCKDTGKRISKNIRTYGMQ